MNKSAKIGFIISLVLSISLIVCSFCVLGVTLGTNHPMEAEIETHEHCDCDDCDHEHCDCDEDCDHEHCDCDGCHQDNLAEVMLSPSTTYYKSGSNFYTRTSRYVSGGTIWRCTQCGAEGEGLTCYHYVSVANGKHTCSAQTGSHSCTQKTGSHSCSQSGYYNHSSSWVTCSACSGNGYTKSTGHGWLGDGTYYYGCTSCGGSGSKYEANFNSHNNGYSAGHGGRYKCSYCNSTSYSSLSGTCTSRPKYVCSYCSRTFSSNSTASCSSNKYYQCSYCSRTFSSNSTASCSSNITGYKCSKCGSTFSSNSTATCYTSQRKDCATTNVGTAPGTTYYTYTNIDTGAVGSETTSSYSTATGFYIAFNINTASATITSGTTGGSMSSQYMLHGHSEALTSNAFTFSGHRFMGWATSTGTQTVTYSNGATINFTTSTVSSGGTYNLYAVWQSQVAKPTASGGTSYQFTNATITHGVSNYNTNYMTRSGTYQASARGSYTVTYALKSGYCWTDNTTSDVSLSWSIIVRTVTIPTVSGSFTYDGSQKSATITNTSSYYSQTGNATGTNAGTYTVYFNLPNTTDYVWSDNTTTQKSGTWTIARQALAVPTISAQPTYTGSSVSPTLSGFNSSLMTQSGDTSAIDVKTSGTYTLTISLTNAAKANYMWVGGTDTAKNLSWNVQPKDISEGGFNITIPQSDYIYDGNPVNPDPVITV